MGIKLKHITTTVPTQQVLETTTSSALQKIKQVTYGLAPKEVDLTNSQELGDNNF